MDVNFLDIKPLVSFIKKCCFRFRNLILYGLIGSFSSSLDFVVFYYLVNFLKANFLLANCVSVTCGICTSFFLNREFNFRQKDKTLLRWAIFFAVGLMGLLISSVILLILINRLYFDKITSKVISIILVVIVQYLLNKYISFNRKL